MERRQSGEEASPQAQLRSTESGATVSHEPLDKVYYVPQRRVLAPSHAVKS